jgi:hypothetical protein
MLESTLETVYEIDIAKQSARYPFAACARTHLLEKRVS